MDKSLKKIIPYAKAYKKNIVSNVIFNVLFALFSSLSFVALIPMMQVLFDETKTNIKKPVYTSFLEITSYGKELLYYYISELTEQKGPQFALLLVISIVIITFLLKNLFNYLAAYNLTYFKNGVLKDLRIKMFDKILSLPISYYSEKRKGDVMARMLGDIGELQNSFFLIFELIVREPLTIIFTIAIMLKISVKLTLFVFIFIPISGFIISKIGKSLKSKSTRAQKESGFFISLVEESLSGLKVIQSYNAQSKVKSTFFDSINRIFKLRVSIGNKNNLASPLSEFLGILTIGALLWYGGRMVLIEKLPNGQPVLLASEFLAYMGLAYNILTPAKAISKASYAVKNGLAAADRVFELIDQEDNFYKSKNPVDLNDLNNAIEVNNIDFSYNNKDLVLKNFNLKVEKGKTVALVGQSGSGKSTIANLLTRFYDINKGEILIDNTNIKEVKLDALRHLIGLVTQDSVLFNDSIKNNILLGKADATDAEVIDALKVANAWEFVNDLPEGIETNVGDAGNKLSGGQKQRLSIARAVLKNPPIMILDEATSALDTESEKLVQEALENMMKNRTSIVIAHRLSTIQNADNIVVMQRGEIVEQGTHQELLAKNGMYKRLVEMQSFD
ncbi:MULTISPECIES: ABC transporter ATP-binding protein [Mesoflavibacter]|uniref:Antibiotic ABC transporter ATP-binding protein n=1 Tax=Mesoflavibacter zeaxanthinifaciens subsp. sabulilitoris TaxID=1520893 RepID=A0A2T1NKN5_9FLAO|nr:MULTISPECIES: ABC transporter ATP-binding protein [Mesoflavibacter]MBB3122576.1 subfamily B ATP-binding cassette protein MsbA [Mesoflavibacter zeaxanthinifaciens subsp. sabulilitoris]PSG93467.1 antibiotic ABC transporter ATP-binding protein [Mesoflavibacter zeaxanthinifaciens subsp. sabulilitoris]UAB75517.1 ABC transporter ATP-binding protein [Mesoflavibacter sp. SCSIO 43206]